MLCYYTECHCAESPILFTIMLSVIMLSVVMLSVFMLSVFMLSIIMLGVVSVIVCDKDSRIEQKFRFYVKCCNVYKETVDSGAAHFLKLYLIKEGTTKKVSQFKIRGPIL